MKKLITFCITGLLALSLQSQDIETKLGNNGSFIIKESSDDEILKLTHDAINDVQLIIGKNIQGVGADVWQLNVQSSLLGPDISFASFKAGQSGPQLYFQKADGPSPDDITAGSELGRIIFRGYLSGAGGFAEGARIESIVESVGSSRPVANLNFYTSNGTIVEERMTIKGDGQVVVSNSLNTATLEVIGAAIANTLNTGSDAAIGGTLTVTSSATVASLKVNNLLASGANQPVYADADGNLTLSTTAPNQSNLEVIIDQVLKENEVLKDRLEKLEAIVEELAK